MHLVLVLKNGGLLSQLLVGYVLLDEHYSLRQVLAALVVTARRPRRVAARGASGRLLSRRSRDEAVSRRERLVEC